jgi:poly(3-hydroxybutyrate) depolymerase
MTRLFQLLLPAALLFPLAASGASYVGIEFPAGSVSFVDAVVSYEPGYSGGPLPGLYNQETFRALGVPRQPSGLIDVSLGNGGRITLQFTDNSLTGSGDTRPDLWIFEVGRSLGVLDEAVYVELSRDGQTWLPVGMAPGDTSGIDIDALGFGPEDRFAFVRLTDDGDSYYSGAVGADIDAVGASSSGPPVPQPVNEQVSFEPVAGSYRTTTDTTGCGPDRAGKFSFDAALTKLTNRDQASLTGMRIAVRMLTGGHRLLTPDGLIGEAEAFDVPAVAGYADVRFDPGESLTVPIVVCLRTRDRFRLFVDVLGIVESGALDATPYYLRFNVDGYDREAKIFPSAVPGPSPVLIYFHGSSGSISEGENLRQFHRRWPEAHVVYAQGLWRNHLGLVQVPGTPGSTRRWSLRHPYKALLGQTDDLLYVQRLLDHLRRTREVDEDRLFAVGFSSGGFFTFSLTETMADQFDGFAILGAYTRYKVDLSTATLDNGSSPPILPLIRGTDRARYPRPVLYMFGSQDTVFDRDSGSNGWPGWHSTMQSLCRSTLEQLIIRNDTEPADFDMNRWQAYWGGVDDLYPGNPTGRLFRPLDDTGAPVLFRPYLRAHSWPSYASDWTVEFFKSLESRRTGETNAMTSDH